MEMRHSTGRGCFAGRGGGGDGIPDDDDAFLPRLEHDLGTFHGLYLDGTYEGFEYLDMYEEGGYHPIHLGDRLRPRWPLSRRP